MSSNGLSFNHFLITFTLLPSHYLCQRVVGCEKHDLNYPKFDCVGLNDYLLEHDFSSYYKLDTVETLWSHLKEFIHHSSSMFSLFFNVFSSKKFKPSNSPMRFNSEIHQDLHKLHLLRKKQKRPNSTINSERVDLAKSPLQNQMVKAKSRYESKLVNEFVFSNKSESYSYLRSFPRMTLFL